MSYVAKDPDIRTAQVFQEKYEPTGVDGVIVLTMKNGVVVGGVSYGNTKQLCDHYGVTLDRFVNWGGQPWF